MGCPSTVVCVFLGISVCLALYIFMFFCCRLVFGPSNAVSHVQPEGVWGDSQFYSMFYDSSPLESSHIYNSSSTTLSEFWPLRCGSYSSVNCGGPWRLAWFWLPSCFGEEERNSLSAAATCLSKLSFFIFCTCSFLLLSEYSSWTWPFTNWMVNPWFLIWMERLWFSLLLSSVFISPGLKGILTGPSSSNLPTFSFGMTTCEKVWKRGWVYNWYKQRVYNWQQS